MAEIKKVGYISICTGSMKQMKVPVKDGETIYLGKDPKIAHIVFNQDYPNVSRVHCAITYDGKADLYYVTDSSTNGSYFMDHTRFVKGKRTSVNSGTKIMLANEKCTIQLENAEIQPIVKQVGNGKDVSIEPQCPNPQSHELFVAEDESAQQNKANQNHFALGIAVFITFLIVSAIIGTVIALVRSDTTNVTTIPDKTDYTVIFETNGGSVVESQTVISGQTAVEPTTPTKEEYIFAGWHLSEADKNLTDSFDFQNTPITQDIILYAVWIGLNDTDGDKLVDDLEIYYGTDINDQDTDHDGLSDYIEIVILGTDPLSATTDGVLDAELDSDGDGLSNLDEIKYGTNPGDKDTDADGLTDGEEIALGTDPLNYDTDNDGASDGIEIKLGTNPLIPDVEFNLSVTSDVGDTVTPSVEITLAGAQVDTLSVSPVFNANLFPEEMPGYIGKAYDFFVDGTFDAATISFEFDVASLSQSAEPTIFYFDEENQSLEELKTTITGNIASAVVEHFSTYILLDRRVYYDSFEWEDAWDTEGQYTDVEIVLVIDDSGSMDWNDAYNQRLVVAQSLIDQLPESSRIGIVRFATNTNLLTPELIADREIAKSYLNTQYFRSSGGTYMYEAINSAFSLFQSTEENVLKMMVVLSDGDTSDTSMHASTIAYAQNNNIRVYTVGLGSSTSYFTGYLKPLSEETHGAFYLAANADELAAIYNDISKKIDIETDSDGDGIPDYYEDHMVSFNGMPIKMDKFQKDSDNDGLLDSQEVEVEIIHAVDPNGKERVYVKGKLFSYPDSRDSDHDGIEDADDPTPMEYTITDRTLALVEGLSYTNLISYIGKTVGYALDDGVSLEGISKEYAEYLRDAVIVHANNSGVGYWKDFWDSGLGSVALKITRTKERTAIIYAIRGTEFDDDFLNDFSTDIVLGIGWDTTQSRTAFSEYKSIATNKEYDYYVTGHSLGGRLAQDVIYKTYNANEGGLFKKKANIPTPVHSATFNALGYNALVYATLENDVLGSYKNKLTNFYYWLDLVGEGLGHSGVYKRAGSDVMLLCRKINGNYYRDKEFDKWLNVRDSDYHGISYFQNDYDLLYTSKHNFAYWVD